MFKSTTSLSLLLLAAVSVIAAPIPQNPSSSPIDFAIAAVDAALSLPSPSSTWNSTAAWYLQNGTLGACGLFSQDTDLVVALPSIFYNTTGSNMTVSPYCGRYLVVTSLKEPNRTVTARIASSQASGMGLSVAAWRGLDGDATNLTSVNWRFATKDETSLAEMLIVEAAFLNANVPAPTVIAAVSQSNPTTVAAGPVYTPAAVVTPVYIAPVYTPPAPAYTPPAASSNAHSGVATWYLQNGNAGACGTISSDDSYIAALPPSSFSPSLCGKQVAIKDLSSGKTITVTVADSCPTCGNYDLDLSRGAFSAMAGFEQGQVAVTWEVL